MVFLFTGRASAVPEKQSQDNTYSIGNITGQCISDSRTFANYPSVAVGSDGERCVARFRHYADVGDEVVVKNTQDDETEVLTPQKGQYLLPVIAIAGN